MYYRARWYDPKLGRFIQADTIVPGSASGAGGGVTSLGYNSQMRLTPLTVNLGQFTAQVNAEAREVWQLGAFSQWDRRTRREHPVPMGPLNPQALNRYSYVLSNPLRYVDPTGHWGVELYTRELSAQDAQQLIEMIDQVNDLMFYAGMGNIAITALLEFTGSKILSAASLSLITGVSVETAAIALPVIGFLGAVDIATTTQDLQRLRDALSDLDAGTSGATITWETIGIMHRLSVTTAKGQRTMLQYHLGEIGSYAPHLFWIWSEANWLSKGGRLWDDR